jgi:hypothetical protein
MRVRINETVVGEAELVGYRTGFLDLDALVEIEGIRNLTGENAAQVVGVDAVGGQQLHGVSLGHIQIAGSDRTVIHDEENSIEIDGFTSAQSGEVGVGTHVDLSN